MTTDLANQSYALYHNNHDGTFDYASLVSGVGAMSQPHSGWGARCVDYDTDGWKDLLVAQGHDMDNIDLVSPQSHVASVGTRATAMELGLLSNWLPIKARNGSQLREVIFRRAIPASILVWAAATLPPASRFSGQVGYRRHSRTSRPTSRFRLMSRQDPMSGPPLRTSSHVVLKRTDSQVHQLHFAKCA